MFMPAALNLRQKFFDLHAAGKLATNIPVSNTKTFQGEYFRVLG